MAQFVEFTRGSSKVLVNVDQVTRIVSSSSGTTLYFGFTAPVSQSTSVTVFHFSVDNSYEDVKKLLGL